LKYRKGERKAMRSAEKSKGHLVDILFTLALFCVFAASSLAVVIIGADVYKDTVAGMDRNHILRTSLAYVCEKVRQNDTQGAVYLDTLEGAPALVLEQNYGEEPYQTWIYYYDGSLREIFTKKENDIALADGISIVDIRGFQAKKLSENLYEISVTDPSGETVRVSVSSGCA
jgi:hypothetical protein